MTGGVKMRAGVEKGTATSRKGREMVENILAVARKILVEDGHSQFSLRNVAGRAGIHLRNLQYYFPTRDRLIHALCGYIADDYGTRISTHLADAGNSPMEQFEAAIDFYLKDIQRSEARRLSMNEWALLASLDEFVGHKLNEYYAERVSNRFVPLVRALNPTLSDLAVTVKCRIIVSLIEGLLIMVDRDESSRQVVERLMQEGKRQAVRIATET